MLLTVTRRACSATKQIEPYRKETFLGVSRPPPLIANFQFSNAMMRPGGAPRDVSSLDEVVFS